MKRLMIGILSAALMGAGFSVNAHQQEMGMQNESKFERSQMMNMHEHMGKTESLMQDIQSNKHPEKRREMMHEHMKQMRKGMDMMRGGGMMDGKKAGREPCPYMDSRMGMMEQRMQMMQRMMRQMMEHQSQRNSPMHR